MIVKNLNDTSTNKCKCDSWLAHWEKFSSKTAGKCVVLNCNNLVEVGAHVQKHSLVDKDWYIIPICKSCNGKKGEKLNISDFTKLVSANVAMTCGPPPKILLKKLLKK